MIKDVVDKFVNETLPVSEWTHEAHIMVAVWHNWSMELEEAYETVKKKIYSNNEAVGTENSDHSGYHETLTRFWMIITHNYLERHDFDDVDSAYKTFMSSHESQREYPFQFYTKDVLLSVDARRRWVDGDLLAVEIV